MHVIIVIETLSSPYTLGICAASKLIIATINGSLCHEPHEVGGICLKAHLFKMDLNIANATEVIFNYI